MRRRADFIREHLMPAFSTFASSPLVAFSILAMSAASTADDTPFAIHKTPGEVRYGLIGTAPNAPSPTLFVFAHSLETMQTQPIYTEVARMLTDQGVLGVAMDAPCHGDDTRPGEPAELNGWIHRLEHDDDFVAAFTAKASAVLEHLIDRGLTDPERVAAYGTSRGGFLAVQFAAADRRIRAVGGISPVTNLLAVREFAGTKAREKAEKLSLVALAPRLNGCSVWLSIGNHDQRVSTDDAIAFTRALVLDSSARSNDPNVVIPVELIVAPAAGHTKIDQAHELLAAWFARQLEGPRNVRP
jgi:dienelactone hydrolase